MICHYPTPDHITIQFHSASLLHHTRLQDYTIPTLLITIIVHTFLEKGGHIEAAEGEGNMATDLGGEVGIKSETLEMDAQHLG